MRTRTLRRSRPPRVVVVEDSKTDTKLIVEGLKRGGRDLHITLICDGEKASSYFGGEGVDPSAASWSRPDLILLDLDLPKKGGAELIAEIKALTHLREVPVVIVSSSAQGDEVRGCYESGASSVVQKPLEPESFVGLVQAVARYWLDVVGSDRVSIV